MCGERGRNTEQHHTARDEMTRGGVYLVLGGRLAQTAQAVLKGALHKNANRTRVTVNGKLSLQLPISNSFES